MVLLIRIAFLLEMFSSRYPADIHTHLTSVRRLVSSFGVVRLQPLQAVDSASGLSLGDWPTILRSSATSQCVIWCFEAAAHIFSD